MPLPPKFNDYRTTNDGVMVADLGFKKQQWALDPALDVVWDWSGERWEVWRFPGQEGKKMKVFDGKACHVMTVQTKERSFRELGADIFLKLQAGDTQKFGARQLALYFEQMDKNIQRAKEKQLRTYIEGVTRESADYMRGVLKVQVPRSLRVERAIVGG